MTEALHAPQPSELVEAFLAEAISNSPQPLKDLADFLSNALSEDDWNTADRLLLALALRNRTSEPEAGAVAWRVRWKPLERSQPGAWREPMTERPKDEDFVGYEIQPLFDHPAPATADKLRVAKEELEAIRDEARSWPRNAAAKHFGKFASDTLAALNEQPQ